MDDQDHESSLRIQQEAAIDQFCSVTGSNEETARNTLEACNNMSDQDEDSSMKIQHEASIDQFCSNEERAGNTLEACNLEFNIGQPSQRIQVDPDPSEDEDEIDTKEARPSVEDSDEEQPTQRIEDAPEPSEDDDEIGTKEARAPVEDSDEEQPTQRIHVDPDLSNGEDEIGTKEARAPVEDSDEEQPTQRIQVDPDLSNDEDEIGTKEARSAVEDSYEEQPTQRIEDAPEPSEDEDEIGTKEARSTVEDSYEEQPTQRIEDAPDLSEDEDEIGMKKARPTVEDSDEEQPTQRIEDAPELSDDEDEIGMKKAKPTVEDSDEEQPTQHIEVPPEESVPDLSSDEEDNSNRRKTIPHDFVYDFDVMMQKRKDSFRRRKRKNIDIINDNDDIIADLIQQMKQAAEDDFELNKNRQAATRKLKLLPIVDTQLRKIDLREAFLDAGVLGVVTDWLTPLPDRSLPNLQVRETMLKLLHEFNIIDVERLKASGIGKAVMYLFKHPKETKENKKRAGVLISNWSRPIFNLDTDFHSMSKEEREQRDVDHMTKSKRMRADSTSDNEGPSKPTKPTDDKSCRPGEKGWISRARVPMPSTRDYVVRPRSSIETDMGRSNKRSISRLDKHLKNFQEKKKQMKTQRAVNISIEGRKMSL